MNVQIVLFQSYEKGEQQQKTRRFVRKNSYKKMRSKKKTQDELDAIVVKINQLKGKTLSIMKFYWKSIDLCLSIKME